VLQERTLFTTPQPSDQRVPSLPQRIAWAILIALTLYVCYFSHLDVIGLVGPDEPRYAWIARDMAESGDWITPRLYGKPWFEKPPLLYWGGAIFFKLLGEGHPEVAARLPSSICALLATLALAWLAWRSYGEQCARWLLLLLPTSVGMIGFSHAAATDMPFAGMLTIAMVCAAVVLGLVPANENTAILPRTSWLALVLFGFFEGLAVLAKGPAGILLIGGTVFFWALFTKRWRDALGLLHPAAIAAFCLTALPWYILCARRNPDFFRIFIIEHNFKRYLTPEFQHIQPFWFYLPILLIAFLPWTALLTWAIYSSFCEFPRNKPANPLSSLLLYYSLFCLLFFSVSRSKLPGYVLPAIPTLGLWLARTVQTNKLKYRRSFVWFALVAGVLFFGIAISAAMVFSGELAPRNVSWLNVKSIGVPVVGALAFCFALSNLFLIFVPGHRTAPSGIPLPLFATPSILVLMLFSHFLATIFPHDPSGRTLSRELLTETVVGRDLFIANMNRGKHYSLNFYLKRVIPDWDPKFPTTGLLLTEGKNCHAIVSAPDTCSLEVFELYESGVFVYEVTPQSSLTSPGSGRHPQ
jgi:4-amino-4-deoxy-L-arabinose transferase-like glycosyltransferase